MLVLTRKIGQQIVIDGNIIVTIVAIEGNRIRVGVQAPKDITVDRAEVHQWKREAPDAEWRSARAAVLV
jgi:carbon storage regulator